MITFESFLTQFEYQSTNTLQIKDIKEALLTVPEIFKELTIDIVQQELEISIQIKDTIETFLCTDAICIQSEEIRQFYLTLDGKLRAKYNLYTKKLTLYYKFCSNEVQNNYKQSLEVYLNTQELSDSIQFIEEHSCANLRFKRDTYILPKYLDKTLFIDTGQYKQNDTYIPFTIMELESTNTSLYLDLYKEISEKKLNIGLSKKEIAFLDKHYEQ